MYIYYSNIIDYLIKNINKIIYSIYMLQFYFCLSILLYIILYACYYIEIMFTYYPYIDINNIPYSIIGMSNP